MPSRRVLIVLALMVVGGITLTFTGHPIIGGLLCAKAVMLYRVARVMPSVLMMLGPRRARSRA